MWVVQTTLNILEAKLASISNIPTRPAQAGTAAAAPAAHPSAAVEPSTAQQVPAQTGTAPAEARTAQTEAAAAQTVVEAPPPPPEPKRHAVKDDPRSICPLFRNALPLARVMHALWP